MVNLLLLLFFSILLSFAVKRDLEEVFPPFVFTLLMGIYATAILGKAHRSFQLSLFAFAGIWIFYIVKERRILPSIRNIKEKFMPIPVGFLCFLGVCALMMYCYHSHFVIGWDDLHYNATFAKDMYYYGTMPVGTASTTHYKDYLPLMQLFYYWGFQGNGGFSEALMFRYKIVLAYTCMLPFFHRMNNTRGIKRICWFLTALILPFISLIEILDSLSMDAVMALMFGYTLVLIMREKKRDWFFYYRVMLGLLALTMMKSIALMFSGICLGVFFFRQLSEVRESNIKAEMKHFLLYLTACLAVFASWGSWKIFCRRNGNSGYLNKMLADDLSGAAIKFPSYASETIRNILKSLFTLHTNFGRLGITVFAAFLITLVLCIIMWRLRSFRSWDVWHYVVLTAGFCVYLLFLIYTYLFLFEQWEAESLSSLDRYLGTYILTLLFVVLYQFYECDWKYSSQAAAVVTLVLLLSLNYGRISQALIPNQYDRLWKDARAVKQQVSEEVQEIDKSLLGNGKILVIDHGGNDFYNRYMDYYLIPHVTEPLNSEDFEMDNYAQEVLNKIKDRNMAYVYITEREGENPNLRELDALLSEGEASIKSLYVYDKETERLKIAE